MSLELEYFTSGKGSFPESRGRPVS